MSNSPKFAGDLPPGSSAEFTDLGAENGTRTDPAIVGDISTLKIAVEGERVQPLNIDNGPHSAEPAGTSHAAASFVPHSYSSHA